VSFGNNVTFGTDWLCFFFSYYCRNPFFFPVAAETLVFGLWLWLQIEDLHLVVGVRGQTGEGIIQERGEWIFPRFETTTP
jgi:hypothetical protein